jgi:alpha-galactosidase
VRVRDELGLPALHQGGGPAWFDAALASREGLELPGVVLAVTGIPMPTLAPAQALVLDVTRVDGV